MNEKSFEETVKLCNQVKKLSFVDCSLIVTSRLYKGSVIMTYDEELKTQIAKE